MTTDQSEKADTFRALHRRGQPLLLPNAWDVASARVVAAAGARAVATTSAGVAWSLGFADGNQLDRDTAVDAVTRIVAAVDVPVSADIEAGYGETADEVAATVRRTIAAGAVGINLEDAHLTQPGRLRPVREQCDRIAAARAAAVDAGVPLFVNARTDTYLRAVGDQETRLDETVDRAAAYVAAGADGVFVPGVTDPDVVSVLTTRIPGPVNVMAGPGAPSVAELAGLGVARVSVGSSAAQAAYAAARRAAIELLTDGGYTSLADGLDFAELNTLPRA